MFVSLSLVEKQIQVCAQHVHLAPQIVQVQLLRPLLLALLRDQVGQLPDAGGLQLVSLRLVRHGGCGGHEAVQL